MILHRYFARRYLTTLASIFGIFFAIMAFLDLVEQLRQFSDVGASFADVVSLTLLNLPQSLYGIFPLIVILSTIALFLGLARSSELVITRAAGRSGLRALAAPAGVAFIVGVVAVAAINPIVASTSREYEVRAASLKGVDAALTLAADGLWLRQGSDEGQTVIKASSSNLEGTQLGDVTFLTFATEGGPTRRVDAEAATLANGMWSVTNAKVWPLADTRNPEAEAQQFNTFQIASNLTADQIRDSFGTPSSIPIWELPGFIQRLQDAGFSARRHAVWLQSELAMPAFLVAMVLVGSAFTMRHQRGGRTGIMVLYAVLISFALYFVRNFATILGENGQIPVMLAAWAPPFGAIGLALGLLLHLEDG